MEKNPHTRIFYTCCSNYLKKLKEFKKIRKTTGWNDSGFGRNTFLDRHQFNCGRNGFISDFYALTKAKNNSGFNPFIRFNFHCIIPVVRAIKRKIKQRELSKIERIHSLLKLSNTKAISHNNQYNRIIPQLQFSPMNNNNLNQKHILPLFF